MSYVKHIHNISKKLSPYIKTTSLELNEYFSNKYSATIYFKREDLQKTRSFKIRGSLNNILKNNKNYKNIITASAGNHAQGFAYACNLLDINGTIYIPKNTPNQKINRIKHYGKNNIDLKFKGYTFNESLVESLKETDKYFIHPYDNNDTIDGQATICKEIYDEINPDYILTPVGGGGLISGIAQYSKEINPNCKIYSIEPHDANSLQLSLDKNERIKMETIDTFVDGASVSQIGKLNYEICKKYIDKTFSVSNGNICGKLINLYQNDGIVLEPAGALSISIFDDICNDIKGKKVVCILSGGNNDITRYQEMVELDLKYRNIKHYFNIKFIQRPGELKEFIKNVLNKNDDISYFKYKKKNNEKYGNVIIGLELENKNNIKNFENNLKKFNYKYNKLE